MTNGNSPAEPFGNVKDTKKHHFCLLYHNFLDAWMPILTPAEIAVFLSVQRVANFGTQSSDGYWSIEICRKLTRLNRKTIIQAMSTCRQLGLIVSVKRPGMTNLIVINQEVMPSPEIIRGGRKGANVWRKGRPSSWYNTDTTNPPNTDTTTWADPSPGSGPGHGPSTGQTPEPLPGPTNYSPIVLESERPKDVDDDDDDKASEKLSEGFLTLGGTLDQKMSKRFLADLRTARPDIEVEEILLIARDRLPVILRNRLVRYPLPYLLKAIVECMIGPTFDNFRRRYQNMRAEEERKNAEIQQILAEQR